MLSAPVPLGCGNRGSRPLFQALHEQKVSNIELVLFPNEAKFTITVGIFLSFCHR